MKTSGALTITAANTGEDITIGTMDGVLSAVHLVNLTVTDLSGTATVGELQGATIGTVTTSGALTITAANTGEDITIGTMDGVLSAVHLVNLTVTDLSGTATVGEFHFLMIRPLPRSAPLPFTTLFPAEDITIGTMDGILSAVHLVNLTVTD